MSAPGFVRLDAGKLRLFADRSIRKAAATVTDYGRPPLRLVVGRMNGLGRGSCGNSDHSVACRRFAEVRASAISVGFTFFA